MRRRQNVIARSITHAILNRPSARVSVLAKIQAFFNLHWLVFTCLQDDLFTSLREGVWQIDEEDYQESFGTKDKKHARLKAMGDMGYSGSTFFSTVDEKYLIKSIPRRFEHSFFKNDLLMPYSKHVRNNQYSLLVRITDFLETAHYSIGTIMGLAPSHHIVMENLLHGQRDNWESYDLKPMSYFYPERDIAGGALASQATKSKLADNFKEKLILNLDVAEAFKSELEKDTRLLSASDAVDYSLFLVRIPRSGSSDPFADPDVNATPVAPPDLPSWKSGIISADGKWVYRAAILDFFWSKHTLHAKAMTGLINSYNVIDRQGPMSVTTSSPEYRERFLRMCADIIELQADTTEQTE